MKSLYRIKYYSGSEQAEKYVVAATLTEAATHLGCSQWVSAFELVHNVLVPGVDKPFPKIEPTPTQVLPPYVPHFTDAEVARLEALLSPAAVAQLRAKLTPEEIADLRVRQLTEAEAADLKIELQTREPHGLSFRHA